jgi:hypothetical protein
VLPPCQREPAQLRPLVQRYLTARSAAYRAAVDYLQKLEPVSELTGLIGLVAQAGGMLEASLHWLLWELKGEGDRTNYGKNPGVKALLDWSEPLVKDGRVAESVRDDALEALSAARAANGRRNDVVHGVWLEGEEAHHNWQERRGGPVMNSFTLDSLREVLADLARADLRVMALARLVRVADGRPVPVPSYELEEQLRGEFDLHGFRSLQLHRYRDRGWQD